MHINYNFKDRLIKLVNKFEILWENSKNIFLYHNISLIELL